MDFKKYFPEVKFDNSKHKQFNLILDELIEAEEVINNSERFLEEMIDLIHISFTTLYKSGYSNKEILDKIDYVKEKNNKRGYYKD